MVAEQLQTQTQHSPVGAWTRRSGTRRRRHKKDERPRQTAIRRKPARADARAAIDETARRPRIVGSPVAIIRKAARVGDAAVSEERYAP